LDSVPNFQRGDKTKYVLDATKERLEKAPKVEGKNYERLYARETAEPIFIYWECEASDEIGKVGSLSY
jgi:hypothetical protein